VKFLNEKMFFIMKVENLVIFFLIFILIFLGIGCEKKGIDNVEKEGVKEETQIKNQKILFSDDFSYETGSIKDKWKVVLKEGLTVSIEGMTEKSGNYGKVLKLRGRMLKIESNWRNYNITTNIKVSSAPNHIGNEIAFRMKDDNNYYVISPITSLYGTTYVFYKVVDGKSYEMSRRASNKRIDDENWHELKIAVNENIYELFVDNEFVMKVEDGEFLEGAIAIMTDPLSVVCFDDFVVISN
jgi:predicted DNA-binding antitoxin AbrB/MazE fold protein